MERFDYSLPIIGNEHVPLLPDRLRENPLRAVQTTKNNLQLRLSRNVKNKRTVDDALMTMSVPYFQEVADAYPHFFTQRDPTMLIHALPEISVAPSDSKDPLRASVEFFNIVFAKLPADYADPKIPERYYLLDAMQPPTNPQEAQQRVLEMGDVISAIVRGVPARNDVAVSKPQLIRTLAFLDVGSSFSYDTNIGSPQEQQERSEFREREIVGHMLDGIEIKSLHEFNMEENARRNKETLERLEEEQAAERKQFHDLLADVEIDLDL